MAQTYFLQLNMGGNDGSKIILPKNDDTSVSVSEKLIKEDVRKLTQNSEEIRKLKEQIDKKKEDKKLD